MRAGILRLDVGSGYGVQTRRTDAVRSLWVLTEAWLNRGEQGSDLQVRCWCAEAVSPSNRCWLPCQVLRQPISTGLHFMHKTLVRRCSCIMQSIASCRHQARCDWSKAHCATCANTERVSCTASVPTKVDVVQERIALVLTGPTNVQVG